MDNVITISNGVPRMPEWRMKEPVNFTLADNEHIAIVGPNGGGKTMLVDIIMGNHPLLIEQPTYNFAPNAKELVSENMKYITFRDAYGGDNDRTYYLQQRWNQQEIDPSTPTVGKILDAAYAQAGDDTAERQALRTQLYNLFHMEKMLDKYIILLSSGELRKLKMTETLLSAPRVLIMDNPFIGLDAETRDQLKSLLADISRQQHLQLILVLSKDNDIPEFITHVVEVIDRKVMAKKTRSEYIASQKPVSSPQLPDDLRQALINLPSNKATEEKNGEATNNADEVVKMEDVTIAYHGRTILKDLNWTVRRGERWALSGQNGAGKSTLLSLVCADNPQSYACRISLFGRQRGSGESIWDIKRNIGYVSPEMHRAYCRNLPTLRIVASGLKDSVGLYVKPDEAELEQCRFWMRMFGLEGKEEVSFLKLSSGEQRLALLARAFVKDPALLILDEPMHGLDLRNRQRVREIIEAFCQRDNKTFIIVTHYKEELPACIDHSLYLKRND